MTLTDDVRADRDSGARRPPGGPPGGLATWVRDLTMGVRFAAGGGRQGWVRTILTAVGVGLGVALLLGASSIPNLLDARNERSQARYIKPDGELRASDRSFRYQDSDTSFRDHAIHGVLIQPDGAHPPLPPGVKKLPGPGEMVVSPALRDLLRDSGSGLLRERLKTYRVVGTIADNGVVGPSELVYYAGSADLGPADQGMRADHYGSKEGYGDTRPMDAKLVLVIIIACVVLLMPVAIFIATAVRFGGEQRDRRLAALRLVGADRQMTRRIAAGEALFGALLGLVLGAAFFLLGRESIGSVTIWDINVFPADVSPVPWLATIVVLAIPASAVAVTLFALRTVSIEPLGVVRGTGERRRRLIWRVAVLVVGLALLLPLAGSVEGRGQVKTAQIATGASLTLFGITLLLPWLVEAVVGRLRGGPVAWQLATRRLQLSSGTAARAVSGITVAVAGTIALQMLFSSVQGDYRKATGMDSERAQLYASVQMDDPTAARKVLDEFRATKGVSAVIGTIEGFVERAGSLRKGEEFLPTETLLVGDCPTLRQIARLTGGCEDGDVFLVESAGGPEAGATDLKEPGMKLNLRPEEEGKKSAARTWTVPKSARTLQSRPDPHGDRRSGIFATPSAVRASDLLSPTLRMSVQLDPHQRDAAEYARNTAARIDPRMSVRTIEDYHFDKRFKSVSTGLFLAAGATMLLIAASMLVSMLEQLRERRRLLSVLVAFGTRRTTMAWSVLWQTAVPVVLGLALAIAGGLGLGLVLLRMLAERTVADWLVFLPLTGIGAAVILVVTVISLPPLWRMMRPDGLRTE
ncbi:FtsX-like permease family protein [Streptomyces varsoviensis]|uniref:FtsX-like permease family protein n=1 Tax=Streptomyces varsoviensis TaxID=67373 RepID=UPI0033E3C51F